MDIAVIGSGPSLSGAGLGPEIDNHGNVMRLHDCGWHSAADHGGAWTFGLIPGPWRHKDFAALIAAARRHPTAGWFTYHFGRPHGCVPAGTQWIDVARWNLRLKRLARRPEIVVTRGFCLFAAAATLRPRRIVGYGFDALAAGDQAGYRYHPDMPRADEFDPAKAAARHDAAAERALLQELAREAGIDIVFRGGAA